MGPSPPMPTLWGLSSDRAKPAGYASIDGVATGFEEAQPDRRRQVVASGNHAQSALQHGAGSERNGSAFADSATVRVDVGGEGSRRGNVRHGLRQHGNTLALAWLPTRRPVALSALC